MRLIRRLNWSRIPYSLLSWIRDREHRTSGVSNTSAAGRISQHNISVWELSSRDFFTCHASGRCWKHVRNDRTNGVLCWSDANNDKRKIIANDVARSVRVFGRTRESNLSREHVDISKSFPIRNLLYASTTVLHREEILHKVYLGYRIIIRIVHVVSQENGQMVIIIIIIVTGVQ